jgi:predicted DCC family thiol-disulfide oxidoreductase YuxK
MRHMSDPDIRVLYNASCPVCRAEIGHYETVSRRHDLPLRFDDLNGPDLARWGISADEAARRLHVLQDGRVLAGLEAFRAIWAVLPRYRWLARVTGWPVVRPVASFTYERILAPVIYRWHLRRVARAASQAPSR